MAAIAAFSLTASADTATDLIKRLEGFKPSVYVCQAGESAIGYGFTDPKLIAKGYISQADADAELSRICTDIRNRLRRELKGQRFSEQEEAALISFIYNVGWYRFKTSTLFRLIRHGKRGSAIANEIRRWVYVSLDGWKVQSKGMQKRRMAEALMFAKEK